MSINIKRVTNANCYANGQSLLGTVEEFNMPDLKMKMSDHKAIGMIGSVEFPSGVDKLELKIKWNSFYANVLALHNPYKAIQLMIRANVETYDSTGRIAEQPLVITATVQAKNIPTGNFKQHDNVELETNFSCTAIKVSINGISTLDYDALANILKINGVDVNANYHINTGA